MSKSSIEEQVEDIAKKQLSEIKYYTKTEVINSEIEKALKIAPSKSGGSGKNFPDIKLFIETKDLRYIPVMIEVKGKKGDFIKLIKTGICYTYAVIWYYRYFFHNCIFRSRFSRFAL